MHGNNIIHVDYISKIKSNVSTPQVRSVLYYTDDVIYARIHCYMYVMHSTHDLLHSLYTPLEPSIVCDINLRVTVMLQEGLVCVFYEFTNKNNKTLNSSA